MVEYRYYPYQSVLAPFIRDYVAEKRALGFIYNVKAYQLYRFDQYWLNNGNGSINMIRVSKAPYNIFKFPAKNSIIKS